MTAEQPSGPVMALTHTTCHFCHVGMVGHGADYCERCERRIALGRVPAEQIYRFMLANVRDEIRLICNMIDESRALLDIDQARARLEHECGAINRLFERVDIMRSEWSEG